MIDRKALLDDLKKLVTKLEKDLRDRCEENAEVDARVRIEYEKAKEAKRTAQAYKVWRDEWITQVAVAWVLGVVFVRFIEDNGLIAAPFIAGPGERLQFAKEQRTAFFQRNPTLSDREYLEHVFREVAKLPAMKELYDERHNPLWALGVSGDGAKLILEQFQKIDPGAGTLVHDFTDREWSTRFLGDLYQDLSEAARKKYALLQTPEFVEEFILDRTLDSAIAEFGLEAVRMIDPTCGSGHFLLGAFARLFRIWEEREPATNRTVLAQRTLDAVYGVDLNPYATAISRFRLLLAAMRASGIKRLVDAPGFEINIATGDSLLHGPRFSATAGVQAKLDAVDDPLRHVYTTEDREDLRRMLGQQYHAVVGNPPYITVKDKALNDAYRQKYGSCSGKYSLSAPFMERFFELAIRKTKEHAAGFVGQITANSFMKREFGAKLIEKFIPALDLTHVIDTSGAYIPGHGTPTVILFGRNQMPSCDEVRAVLGVRGEPSTPSDPARGEVWSAITLQVDQPGTTSAWVSATDAPRSGFHKHPWSIGGAGAAELKEQLETLPSERLDAICESIGFMDIAGDDDFFVIPDHLAQRRRLPVRPSVTGDAIRDWTVVGEAMLFFPYDDHKDGCPAIPPAEFDHLHRYAWPFRTTLRARSMFGKTVEEHGFCWWEHMQFIRPRVLADRLIAFAEVASHNHFVLDRGGRAFKQTAPVIDLPAGAGDDEYFALLAYLNSSTACFWMKQVAHQKQMTGGDGVRVDSKAKVPYQFSGTQLGRIPIPLRFASQALRTRLITLAKSIDSAARASEIGASAAINAGLRGGATEIAAKWAEYLFERKRRRSTMILLQEEIDFTVYRIWGFVGDDVLADITLFSRLIVEPGMRPFELLNGVSEDGHDVPTDIPTDWPAEVVAIWRRRMEVIAESEVLRLIEDAHYKRRWVGRQGLFNSSRQRDELKDRCAEWLVSRIDAPEYWAERAVRSVAQIADSARGDVEFNTVAEVYRGSSDFDLTKLVVDLVSASAVPMLPALRYKESGLAKRAAWEDTWEIQRRQDRGEQVGDIPLPPKLKPADFRASRFWSNRNGLDLPKERFVSFVGCEREADPSLPILWAGLDHLQQARAIAAYYQDLKDNEAAPPDKLGRLLACILELLPWLKQWHNEIDAEYGTRMGDFFESFMHAEMAGLGLTMDDLRKIRGL